MKFLSNVYNPNLPDAKSNVARLIDQTEDEAWYWHKRWLEGKIIGRPIATKYFTVEQLESMNLVGVYLP